jgi:predicted lipid-binding transport protein (Tim44 family)
VQLDILIFAIIAAFLIYRLNAVLGTKRDDGQPRRNPFAANEAQPRPVPAPPPPMIAPKPARKTDGFNPLIDSAANKNGRIDTGLDEIAAVDPHFDVNGFMDGARYAFETIVAAYNKGDRDALRPLLSPKLYADFAAEIKSREESGHITSTEIHRITAARIVEAHLGGTMAYITVDYDVEQTTVTRDKAGAVVEGNPDRIFNVEDIWTFTRDTRAEDPNWILIETRTAEK